MKRAVVALASFFVLGIAPDALAANACVSAADKGQDLRSAGKLDEARALFLVCAKPACNRVVRADCERWMKEIDEEISQAAERERERERDRAAMAEPPAVDAARSSARVSIAIADPATSSASSSAPAATFPVAPAVLGGLGVLSLAAFGYFQAQGWSRYSTLEDGCAKTQSCTDADIEATRSQFVASGAALGVSVVSFGVAAILYFTRGHATEPPRIGIRPGGAAVSF